MKYLPAAFFSFVFAFAFSEGFASSIVLYKKDAEVWFHRQTITGKLSGFYATKVKVHRDESSFIVSVNSDSTFTFNIILQYAKNKVWVSSASGNAEINSDTVVLTIGYQPLPVVKPYASVSGNKIKLHAQVIENPYKKILKFFWISDTSNPASCTILHPHQPTATVTIPAEKGIYYFNLLVVAGKDSAWFQTFVTRNKTIRPFDMDKEHAAWIDDAVIYEITPFNFVKKGTYDDITQKLPELKELGINTIWLQPVFESNGGGQGYDIIDYFSLRPDLGTEAELSNLIATAKFLQMRVLFDFVPNHTSIRHPYALDCIEKGKASHYYNYYQRHYDGAPYSSFYHTDENGFIYYFWKKLVNLNYENKEVQQWMMEAFKYWVKKFDIDGYRFDAVWAVNAREPLFAKRLQTELKSIKPDLLFLAEDKGSVPQVYKLGFDAAYDWAPDTSWISKWWWQYDIYGNHNITIFNFPEVNKRGAKLRKSLFNTNPSNLILRFLENNDMQRFITAHNVRQTKMAAALLFSVSGIPMLYNGQEIGFEARIYSPKPVFEANKSIQSLDRDSLFSYYQHLIKTRKKYPALRSHSMKEIPVAPDDALVSFYRQQGNQQFVVIINMSDKPATANINLKDVLNANVAKFALQDVLTDEGFQGNSPKIQIRMNEFSVRWLLLTAQMPTTAQVKNEYVDVE